MVSFFGLISHLDPPTTLVVFCSLVFSLIGFEHFLEKVEHHAEEAKFSELVKKLYKELMIMGFIGFLVFILFNALTLDGDENFLAFEFAHITIFFMSIILVFRAIFVVVSSNRATAGFWRAHNQKCSVLLDRYSLVKSTCWSMEALGYKYFPIFSGLFADIEYKIMEDFFHSDFNMSRYEFSFVDYLTMSNKLYAIEKVEMSYVSWFVVIVLAVLNYIRIVLTRGNNCRSSEEDGHHDDHGDDDHHRRALSGDDGADFTVSERCANYNTHFFMVSGFALMCFGLLLCYITWRSKVKLLQIAGNDDTDNYYNILQSVMTREQDTFLVLAQKNEDMEAEAVDAYAVVFSAPRQQLGKASRASVKHLITEEKDSWHVISLRQVIEEQKKRAEDEEKRRREKLKQRCRGALRSVGMEDCWWLLVGTKEHESDGLRKLVHLTKKRRAFGVRSNSLGHGQEENAGGRRRSTRRLSQPAFLTVPHPKVQHQKSLKKHLSGLLTQLSGVLRQMSGRRLLVGEAEECHPLMFELDSIFLLENRQLYNELLEVFQLLCALHLSLYLTNFLFIALESQHAVINNLFILLSTAVLLLVMSFTQFHSNLLFSVTSLRNGAADWICEQDAIKSNILPRLRDELMNIIETDHFAQEIEDLYGLVREGGRKDRGGISMREFSNLLFTLNIHLNHEELQCVFRVLNVTGSGLIGVRELKELLRPNSSFISTGDEKPDRFSVPKSGPVKKRETLLSLDSQAKKSLWSGKRELEEGKDKDEDEEKEAGGGGSKASPVFSRLSEAAVHPL